MHLERVAVGFGILAKLAHGRHGPPGHRAQERFAQDQGDVQNGHRPAVRSIDRKVGVVFESLADFFAPPGRVVQEALFFENGGAAPGGLFDDFGLAKNGLLEQETPML